MAGLRFFKTLSAGETRVSNPQTGSHLIELKPGSLTKTLTLKAKYNITIHFQLKSTYFSRRLGSLWRPFTFVAYQRSIIMLIGATMVLIVNHTLVKPPFW